MSTKPTDLRCLNNQHAWGDIQDGYIYCDRCPARHPITPDEAAAFIWGAGPKQEWLTVQEGTTP